MTAGDLESGTARIASVADRFDTDVVVNLQGDAPLTDPGVVAAAAGSAAEDRRPVTMAVYPLARAADVADPNTVKVIRGHDGRVLYCSRAAIPYIRDEPVTGNAGQPSALGPLWDLRVLPGVPGRVRRHISESARGSRATGATSVARSGHRGAVVRGRGAGALGRHSCGSTAGAGGVRGARTAMTATEDMETGRRPRDAALKSVAAAAAALERLGGALGDDFDRAAQMLIGIARARS